MRARLGTPKRVALVLGAVQALLSAFVLLATQASESLLVYVVLTFVVCAAGAIVALDDALADRHRRVRDRRLDPRLATSRP